MGRIDADNGKTYTEDDIDHLEISIEELKEVAQTWLSFVPDKSNSRVATYSVTSQRDLLGLNTLAEQMTLFILLVDGNLDMLRIHEEECRMKNTERRIIEEFGYYNPELLILERKFHTRFCPNKQISIWSKTKTLDS